MRIIHLLAFGSALGAGVAVASPAKYAGHELAGQAKISIERARVVALRARPGKITSEELEKERGGSGLRYSFDVKAGGKTFEVGVDAVTGRVLENGTESAMHEAKEEIGEHLPLKKKSH